MDEPLDYYNQEDRALYKRLVRDICLLYHQLSDYRRIMGDLDYSEDFPLEYCKIINRLDHTDGHRFIRGGILILFLAMIDEVLIEAGDHISRHAKDVLSELERFIPEDTEMLRLSEAVEYGLSLLLAKAKGADEHFEKEVCWAYNAFVRKYFIDGSA
ncbi:MAG: hypothetical protein ACO1RA_12600 [Planctomycetaceae bacterium]